MLKISSEEQLSLAKLASSLPVGSSERKAILAALTAPDWRQEYADQKFANRTPGPNERMATPHLQKGDLVTVRGYRGRPIRGMDDTDPLDQGTLIPIGSEATFVKRGPVLTQIIFKGRTLSIYNGYLDAVKVGSNERKAILAALTAPDYLPKAGLTPFKKISELMEEAPESLMKGRLLKLTQGMEASAKNFYNRGERFKPQARNVSEDAGELLGLLSELQHPKEKELEKLLKGVIKDFSPILKSLS